MVEVRYYDDRRGVEQVREYINELAASGERSVLATFTRLVDLMEEQGAPLGMPQDRLIDRRARIYELRPGNHRVAYAEHAGVIVLLYAWRKQSQRLDRQALGQAQRRLADWKERH